MGPIAIRSMASSSGRRIRSGSGSGSGQFKADVICMDRTDNRHLLSFKDRIVRLNISNGYVDGGG